jgi:hypothetical protein
MKDLQGLDILFGRCVDWFVGPERVAKGCSFPEIKDDSLVRTEPDYREL